jgi:aspartate/methionine/tyrosine aminotransferase
MSKTFGLPGIRIGWIATRDADLMHRLLAAREHITITNNVLGEHIALQVQRDPELFSPALGLASPRTAPSSPT